MRNAALPDDPNLFYGLTNRELMIATGTWVYHTASLMTESKDLFHDVIENPDKDDLHTNTIESKYYDIKQTGAFFRKASSKGFSILSCNTRSLPKIFVLLTIF